MKVIDIIKSEVSDYIDVKQETTEGVSFSQSKVIKRINLYKNREYPLGKIDKRDASYKYWPDIIAPLVEGNVKNLRFTTKNILAFSKNPIGDFAAVYTINMSLDEWMWETGRAEELNESIEAFTADGNVLFKKVKGGYTLCDAENTFIINQAAKTVDQTPVIERFELTQSELRAKEGVWSHVSDVIEKCGNKFYQRNIRGIGKATTMPLYEVFERNGEISEAALFEAQGKEGGDPDKYLLARVTVAGISKNDKDKENVLFAEKLSGPLSDYFVEAHRGPYKGRWWREGLYELLFDHQYRACEIAIQLSRGLDWASKVIFKDDAAKIVHNIRTDIANGAVIKSANLAQVEVRMQGVDQLIADWNRNLEDARRIANAYEIVQGETMPANMPFALGQLIDVNASKLFVYLRQKLGTAYSRVFKEFVLPELVKDLSVKEVLRITGDAQVLDRFRKLAVEDWYVRQLIAIPPHGPEVAEALKQSKLEEIAKAEPLMRIIKEMWKNVLTRIYITITGENYETAEHLQTIASVLQFETDPVRRAYLLDTIYAAKGIAVPPAVQQAIPQISNADNNAGKSLAKNAVSPELAAA